MAGDTPLEAANSEIEILVRCLDEAWKAAGGADGEFDPGDLLKLIRGIRKPDEAIDLHCVCGRNWTIHQVTTGPLTTVERRDRTWMSWRRAGGAK